MTAGSAKRGWRYGNAGRDEAVFPVDGLQFATLVSSKWSWYTTQVTWTRSPLRADLSLFDYDSTRGSVMNFVPVDLIPQAGQFIRERGMTWADEHDVHFQRHLSAPSRLQPPINGEATHASHPDTNQTLTVARNQTRAPLPARSPEEIDDEEELEMMKAHAQRAREHRIEVQAMKEETRKLAEMFSNSMSKPAPPQQIAAATTRGNPPGPEATAEKAQQQPVRSLTHPHKQRDVLPPSRRPVRPTSPFPESMYDD